MAKQEIILATKARQTQTSIGAIVEARGIVFHITDEPLGYIASLSQNKPLILLLDWDLQGKQTPHLIRRLRESFRGPIITLAKTNQEKSQSLQAGGDDYLDKLFRPEELFVRLRIATGLLEQQGKPPENVIINGELRIDVDLEQVTLKGVEVHLTPLEFRLLCLLGQNLGRVLTHQTILDRVWGEGQTVDTPSLRVFMGTLRKKVEGPNATLKYIQTHIGIGYRMLYIP